MVGSGISGSGSFAVRFSCIPRFHSWASPLSGAFWRSPWSALGVNREGQEASCSLVSLCATVMKQSGTIINPGRKGLVPSHTAAHGPHGGKSGQTLRQEQKPRRLIGLLASSCLTGFLLQARNTTQGRYRASGLGLLTSITAGGGCTMGWALSHQSLRREGTVLVDWAFSRQSLIKTTSHSLGHRLTWCLDNDNSRSDQVGS